MTRIRWMHFDCRSSALSISKAISAAAFTPSSSHGFLVDRVREDYFEARYIEKVEYLETILDPFDNEISQKRVEYRKVSFRMSDGYPNLELYNLPRGSNGLLNKLTEMTQFLYPVNSIDVDTMLWLGTLQEVLDMNLLVDSLEVGSIMLGEGVVAKATISGDRDVRASTAAFTQNRKHEIEKLQFKLPRPLRGSIALSSSGSARITSMGQDSKLVSALRRSLESASAATSTRS